MGPPPPGTSPPRREPETVTKEDRKRLGPQWRRRLEACLDTLIDGEGIVYREKGPNGTHNLAEVCDAIRNALEDDR